jgi:hypothetical protein
MTREEQEFVTEVLRSAKVEIEAMEDTFHEYVASGHLLEQLEEAIRIMGGTQQ